VEIPGLRMADWRWVSSVRSEAVFLRCTYISSQERDIPVFRSIYCVACARRTKSGNKHTNVLRCVFQCCAEPMWADAWFAHRWSAPL
jgi:hypothetical protein